MGSFNTHESLDRAEEAQSASDKSFGGVFIAVFLIVGLLPLRHGLPVRLWALTASGVLAIVTLARPGLLHPANIVWTWVGTVLHKIVGPLVTGLLFYVVFTPTGMLMRRFGKDVLKLRKDPGNTYWIARTKAGQEPGSMTRQF